MTVNRCVYALLSCPEGLKQTGFFVCSEKLFMKHETTCHVPPSCHCESQTRWRMTGGFECRDRLSKHTQSPNMPTHTYTRVHRPAEAHK